MGVLGHHPWVEDEEGKGTDRDSGRLWESWATTHGWRMRKVRELTGIVGGCGSPGPPPVGGG